MVRLSKLLWISILKLKINIKKDYKCQEMLKKTYINMSVLEFALTREKRIKEDFLNIDTMNSAEKE